MQIHNICPISALLWIFISPLVQMSSRHQFSSFHSFRYRVLLMVAAGLRFCYSCHGRNHVFFVSWNAFIASGCFGSLFLPEVLLTNSYLSWVITLDFPITLITCLTQQETVYISHRNHTISTVLCFSLTFTVNSNYFLLNCFTWAHPEVLLLTVPFLFLFCFVLYIIASFPFVPLLSVLTNLGNRHRLWLLEMKVSSRHGAWMACGSQSLQHTGQWIRSATRVSG